MTIIQQAKRVLSTIRRLCSSMTALAVGQCVMLKHNLPGQFSKAKTHASQARSAYLRLRPAFFSPV
jgi:hypothetical protein